MRINGVPIEVSDVNIREVVPPPYDLTGLKRMESIELTGTWSDDLCPTCLTLNTRRLSIALSCRRFLWWSVSPLRYVSLANVIAVERKDEVTSLKMSLATAPVVVRAPWYERLAWAVAWVWS